MVKRRFFAIALMLVAGLSALEIGGFGILSAARQSLAADAKGGKENGAEIAKLEIVLSKEALTIVAQAEREGRANPGSQDVLLWSRRLVESNSPERSDKG